MSSGAPKPERVMATKDDPLILTVTVRIDPTQAGLFDEFGDDDELEMVAYGLADEYLHPANVIADFSDMGDADNWTARFDWGDRTTSWPAASEDPQ